MKTVFCDAMEEMQCLTHQPELDEVLERGCWDKETVEKRVADQKNKELVAAEANAVVHPAKAETSTQ